MKISVHITHYYNESRWIYLRKIIKEYNNFPYLVDIFIHTTQDFKLEEIGTYNNGEIQLIVHNTFTKEKETDIPPDYCSRWPLGLYLTWKHRDLMKEQKDKYDIFMYSEDDILIPKATFLYWLKYKYVTQNGWNLGFFVIETDENNEYAVNSGRSPDGKYNQCITKTIDLNGYKFAINDQNPYCCSWIYDKTELEKFINSKYWNVANVSGPGPCEKAAFGGRDNYKATIIPLVNNNLHNDCKVYHLPNKYIKVITLNRFEDIVQL